MFVTCYKLLPIFLFLQLSQSFIFPMLSMKFNPQALDALVREAIDDTKFTQLLSSETTKFIPILNGKNFAKLIPNTDMYEPVFLSSDEVSQFSQIPTSSVAYYYLGNNEEVSNSEMTTMTYIVANMSTSTPLPSSLQTSDIKCDMLRFFADQLNSFDQNLLTHARGLAVWHDSCQFCSKCGSKTTLYRQGGGRKCTNSACKMSHYPRIEPAVIMAITSKCNNHLLLGRKKEWPKGRFSTLAGFLEVGETLEDAVIRETWEESGVMVNREGISYVRSQPWPFPSSFMLGFIASALDSGLPAINVDTNEMEDVRWFSREQVLTALSPSSSDASVGAKRSVSWDPDAVSEVPLHFPGKSSLARKLIESWAAPSSI